MKKEMKVNKMTITAVCIALCIVLPMAFHMIPNAGSILSPMHIPVMLCGLVCGGSYGLLCGIAGTLLSSLLTGMPGMAYLPAMMLELAVYGLVAGLLINLVHTGKFYMDIYISLAASMIAGRLAAGALQAVIYSAGDYSLKLWLSSYFLMAWPAIVLQLVVIPVIVLSLKKAKLVPERNSAAPVDRVAVD